MSTPTESDDTKKDYLDNIVYSATDALVLGIPMNLLGKITYEQAITGDYENPRFDAWKNLIDEVFDTTKGKVQEK
jgi:hypothetical protein